MNQPITNFVIEELTSYSSDDAARIGQLLPHLSDKFDDSPISQDLLSTIIDSPLHAQLVARAGGEIIGLATLSIIFGIGAGRNAWLDDFVVSPDARGSGVADTLGNAMIDWCATNQAKSLNFTSKPSREAAHRFYSKHGAEIRETNVFKKTLS